MSDRKKGLHWEEILESLKKHFTFESAQYILSATQARVHYIALLFYTCQLAWYMYIQKLACSR